MPILKKEKTVLGKIVRNTISMIINMTKVNVVRIVNVLLFKVKEITQLFLNSYLN